LFEAGARQLHLQVLGARGICRDVRQVDLCFHYAGKLDLRFFGRFAQPLQCLAIVPQVDVVFFFELCRDPVDDGFVPIIAAQVRVAVGGFDFDYAVAHLQQAHIECAAAQVEYQDGLVFFLVQPISQGRGCWLVNNAQYVQSGDAAGVLVAWRWLSLK